MHDYLFFKITYRDGKGRLPYVIAGNKETRQEFRRFVADFPDMYDYTRSQVFVNWSLILTLSLQSDVMMMIIYSVNVIELWSWPSHYNSTQFVWWSQNSANQPTSITPIQPTNAWFPASLNVYAMQCDVPHCKTLFDFSCKSKNTQHNARPACGSPQQNTSPIFPQACSAAIGWQMWLVPVNWLAGKLSLEWPVFCQAGS